MEHRRIIKRGPIVLATHEDGSMDPSSTQSQGLFLGDTRYLSTFNIRLNGLMPVLMGSSEEILFQTEFIFTNPELEGIPARGIGILQRNTIEEASVRIKITLANWSMRDIDLDLAIGLDSDFFDSFEARGVKRLKRGTIKTPEYRPHSVDFSYVGLDNVTRSTHIDVSPHIDRCDEGCLHFRVQIKGGKRKDIELNIKMVEAAPEGISLEPRPEVTRSVKPPWWDEGARITTGNAAVDAIIMRGLDDLQVLMTEFSDGWVPSAGLPRFAVPFGRDSLITGIETLMWNPDLAASVLRFLAHRQGKEENPWNYEQPGKIMHEMHTGELARCREVPFGLFYGSVDSTVYFLVLGGEYIRWTGDLELWRGLKPNFDAAWNWIDDYGDIDKSGYVQYKAHTPPKLSSAALTVGLFNQGWKDSANSVVYGDGTIVTAENHPISLAEVQGDLYRALQLWGEIYRAMPGTEGMAGQGDRLLGRAAELKAQFNEDFWMPRKGYYAMALDGHHRQVDSITSNPLQCLWARLVDDEHVEPVVKHAFSASMFTSWGIRTMANTEKAYNPFSYHNGSVWPFENALITAGLKKYGLVEEVARLFHAMVDSSLSFEYRRWPEVYAGVSKEVGGVIARQPDASRPQAWSAGAIFLLLQTLLGVSARPFSPHVDITPALPPNVDEIVVENMSIAGGRLGLRVVREGKGILMEILHNPNDLSVVIHPATRNGSRLSDLESTAVSS